MMTMMETTTTMRQFFSYIVCSNCAMERILITYGENNFFFDQQKIFKLYRSVQFEDFILFTEVVDISTTYHCGD